MSFGSFPKGFRAHGRAFGVTPRPTCYRCVVLWGNCLYPYPDQARAFAYRYELLPLPGEVNCILYRKLINTRIPNPNYLI